MPLVKSFALRSKKNPKSYFEAIVKKGNGTGNQITGYKITDVNPGIGSIKRSKATCVACGGAVTLDYIKEEGKAGRLGTKLVALVVDLGRGKGYIAPTQEQEKIALETPIE